MHDAAYTTVPEGLNAPYTFSWGFYEEDGGWSSEIWTIAYVDVPWNQQDRLWSVRTAGETYPDAYAGEHAVHALYARRTDDGLYCVVDGGVELWRAGRLRQTWDLKMTPDSFLSTDQFYSDNILVYADGKLYELFDDGEAGIVIDNIVSVNPEYTFLFCCFTLSDDGTLRFCGADNGKVNAVEIAKDVVAADLSNERLVLYTDISGKTYAIYDFLGSDAGMGALSWGHSYKVACLGEGSIGEFKELYETYEREHEGCNLQEQFIEEMSAAYLATVMEDQPIQP